MLLLCNRINTDMFHLQDYIYCCKGHTHTGLYSSDPKNPLDNSHGISLENINIYKSSN